MAALPKQKLIVPKVPLNLTSTPKKPYRAKKAPNGGKLEKIMYGYNNKKEVDS